MRVLGICLSDIPKERIKKADNGKKYINIVETEMKQPDKFGNDLTVYVQQSKEEREAGAPKIYIGNGKTYNFEKSSPTPENIESMGSFDPTESDDLPF